MIATLKTTHPIARKTHHCDFCYGKIESGQRYIRETNVCDGDVYDWLEHEECREVCRELDMWSDCDPDYGISSEVFQEIVDQAIYDTFSEEVRESEWDHLTMYEKIKKFLNYLKTDKK